MIVDGMVHGGVAQGIGQALWEGAVYDDGSGQLVTGTMMDYALPKADMLPMYETDRTVTPTPRQPLGIKGAGETGTIAATPRWSTPSSMRCARSAWITSRRCRCHPSVCGRRSRPPSRRGRRQKR